MAWNDAASAYFLQAVPRMKSSTSSILIECQVAKIYLQMCPTLHQLSWSTIAMESMSNVLQKYETYLLSLSPNNNNNNSSSSSSLNELKRKVIELRKIKIECDITLAEERGEAAATTTTTAATERVTTTRYAKNVSLRLATLERQWYERKQTATDLLVDITQVLRLLRACWSRTSRAVAARGSATSGGVDDGHVRKKRGAASEEVSRRSGNGGNGGSGGGGGGSGGGSGGSGGSGDGSGGSDAGQMKSPTPVAFRHRVSRGMGNVETPRHNMVETPRNVGSSAMMLSASHWRSGGGYQYGRPPSSIRSSTSTSSSTSSSASRSSSRSSSARSSRSSSVSGRESEQRNVISSPNDGMVPPTSWDVEMMMDVIVRLIHVARGMYFEIHAVVTMS